MLLIVSVLLALAACFVTWKIAYKLANPLAPLHYSKSVGWVAGTSGLPFMAASIIFANMAMGKSFATAMAVAVIIGMLIASPVGEGMGLRDKSTT